MFIGRYGDEEHLITLVGVIQTLVSFSEVTECGQLNYIKAGRARIAFLNKDPLILVLISHTNENAMCLTQQLTYAYHQIISTLTLSRIKHKFSVQPNFDLRRWLSNAEKKLLHNIIDMYERDLGMVMTCAKCLILPMNIRTQIGHTVAQTVRGQKVRFPSSHHSPHALLSLLIGYDLRHCACAWPFGLDCPSEKLPLTPI